MFNSPNKRNLYLVVFSFLFLAFFAGPLSATKPKKNKIVQRCLDKTLWKIKTFQPAQQKVTKLSLQSMLQMLLKRNPALARERLAVKQAQMDLLAAQGGFRFDLDLDLKLNRTTQPGGIQAFGQFAMETLSRGNVQIQGGVTLSKRFSAGTTMSVRLQQWWNSTDIRTRVLDQIGQENNRQILRADNMLQFSITQPLLQGAFLQVNLSPIWQAEEKVKMVRGQVARYVNNSVAMAVRAYWELVYARRNIQIQKDAFTLARKQLDNTITLIEAGKLAPLECFQVRQVVAARQGDLLVAYNAVAQAETQLRSLLYLPHDHKIIPQDSFKGLKSIAVLTKLLETAEQENPDLWIAKHQLNISKKAELVAQNNTRPRLDVTGSFSLVGTASSSSDTGQANSPLGESLGNLFDPRSHAFQIALVLKVPLDNRSANARYQHSQISSDRARLQIRYLKRQLSNEIRQLYYAAMRARQRVPIARVARIWAQEKLKAEVSKRKLGKTTLFNVLRYQQDLATSRLTEVRALIDYQKAWVSLHEKIGTLPTHYNISRF